MKEQQKSCKIKFLLPLAGSFQEGLTGLEGQANLSQGNNIQIMEAPVFHMLLSMDLGFWFIFNLPTTPYNQYLIKVPDIKAYASSF